MRTLLAFAAVAALAACSQETKVEEPEAPATVEAPVLPPVPAPTVVMITEADARTRIETAGYTNVTALTQNADGTWTATATRDGAPMQISVGEGGVTVVTPATP